jgi:hypothetical protein
MEVHHHPDFRKKHLKEYFFEGLMIFMAVTLGFFAERLRENLAEHAKEREFIISMIEDAETDIKNIQTASALNKIRVLKLDTLASRCYYHNSVENNDGSLYCIIKDCIKHPDFVCPVERTILQLKNAGGMRLIENPVAVNSIIYYDEVTKKMVNQQVYYERHLNALIDASEQLFNFKCFPLNHATLTWESDPVVLSSAALISHDKNAIITLGNKAKIYQGIVMFYLVRLEEVRRYAADLINSLKREYDIE